MYRFFYQTRNQFCMCVRYKLVGVPLFFRISNFTCRVCKRIFFANYVYLSHENQFPYSFDNFRTASLSRFFKSTDMLFFSTRDKFSIHAQNRIIFPETFWGLADSSYIDFAKSKLPFCFSKCFLAGAYLRIAANSRTFVMEVICWSLRYLKNSVFTGLSITSAL